MSQTHADSDGETDGGTPRWVKVFGIIAIVLILLFIVLHLTGNSLGGHGNHTPPIEHGGQQP